MQWNTHDCQMSAFLKHSNLDKHVTDSMLNVFFCKTFLSRFISWVTVSLRNVKCGISAVYISSVNCQYLFPNYSELITNTENGEIIFRPWSRDYLSNLNTRLNRSCSVTPIAHLIVPLAWRTVTVASKCLIYIKTVIDKYHVPLHCTGKSFGVLTENGYHQK